MAKKRRNYVCSSCGAVELRWMGKCPSCGTWDSLEELAVDASSDKDPQRGLASAWANAAAGPDGHDLVSGVTPSAVPIREATGEDAGRPRLMTGIGEFDRVLGGGIVPGAVVLLGGDPGIGKSTLLLQGMGGLAARKRKTLYVTSEESAEQVKLRAERLGVLDEPEADDNLFVLADTNLARIVEQARKVQPEVLVIDSIQMVYKADLDASPGSVTQIRRCCTDLVYLAKASGVAVVLIGHVTKEGTLAGPRLLEHLVDVVLYFEGDRYHAHRVVRSIKNRFGNTLEIGLFEMGQKGLTEVPDGASVAAGALGNEPRPGSCVVPTVSGSRCVLVEMQALTATGFPGSVKRKASGVDTNRLAMLIAVLEQHAGINLYDRDVFASSVGGVRVSEPASDLALAMAITGSHLMRALPHATAAVGEVGLGGEIRPVTQMEARIREAARLGYTRLLVPVGTKITPPKGLKLIEVRDISMATQELSDTPPVKRSVVEAKARASQAVSRD